MNFGKAMRDAADPLPFHGGEAWQGEPPFDVQCQKHVNFKTDQNNFCVFTTKITNLTFVYFNTLTITLTNKQY